MPDDEKDKDVEQQPVQEKAVDHDPADDPIPAIEPEDKEPDKEEPAEEQPQEFDAEIISIAADMGMSEAQARSFSTVSDLELALLRMSERAEQKPEEKKEEPKKPEFEPILLEQTEDLDEAVVKRLNEALGKLAGRYDEKVAAQEKALADLHAHMQANQAAQFVARFDDMLAKYGEPYVDEVGEGSTAEMSGKHRLNRDKVVEEMGMIVAACQLRKRPIPSDPQLVQRALKEVFGGKEKDKDNSKDEKSKTPYLRRGSSRSSAAPSRQMRAKAELREKLAALSGGGDE